MAATEVAQNRPLDRARQLWRDRRRRDELFADHRDGLGDPAWDMLLALFVACEAGSPWTPTADLVASISAPSPVVRPYATWLVTQKLAQQLDDLTSLTVRGRELMLQYFESRTVESEKDK